MDKARFIARTWRRVPAEERDVFTVSLSWTCANIIIDKGFFFLQERAKQNRKLLTAAGKIKSTPKVAFCALFGIGKVRSTGD